MDKVTLEAKRRNPSEESARDLRDAGRIPMELYGKDVENMSLHVDYQEFRKAFNKAGQSTLVELTVDGKSVNVMIHDYDTDPVYDTYTHVDVKVVNMKATVDTTVQLNFVGVAPAVKDLNGILNIAVEEVHIRCLPTDLIHHIDVDLSSLVDFHSVIHLNDLAITKDGKYEILTDADLTICSVSAPQEEETDEDETTVDPANVPTEREEKQAAEEAAE